jgi:hypothetical protein
MEFMYAQYKSGILKEANKKLQPIVSKKQNVNLNLKVCYGHQKRNKKAFKNSFRRDW